MYDYRNVRVLLFRSLLKVSIPLELSGKKSLRSVLVNIVYQFTTSGPVSKPMQLSRKRTGF